MIYTYGCMGKKGLYRQIPEQEPILQQMMQDALLDYNARSVGKQQLDVVFFRSIIEKVIKINRSL